MFGPEELVAGAFLPAVEAPLVSAHEVLAGQHRMLFVPDDRLGEVQACCFQHRWIVAAVGVAAPDVERPSRLQAPERCCRTTRAACRSNSSSVTKSFASGRSFARIFLCVGFDFSGCRAKSNCLVVIVREGTVARGDGVVAPRLDLHVVRRVGVDQLDRGAGQEPIHVLRLAAVAAEQPVVTQDPQVARLRDRLVGRLGHLVGIGQSVLHARIEQLGQVVLREAEQFQVDVHALEFAKLDRQQLVVPLRQFGRLVVGDPVGLDLLGRQIRGDVDRHLLQAQLQCGLVAGVADR